MNGMVGYSFWGFLGDKKFDKNGNEISTPDGNAFYSWSIIRELQKRGNRVLYVCPDRDSFGWSSLGYNLFSSWAKKERTDAYLRAVDCLYPFVDYRSFDRESLFRAWDRRHLKDCDFILHEWRMEIPGRNDCKSKDKEGWQPDLLIQDCLLEYCESRKIKLVIFDLDYKLLESKVEEIKDFVKIIELGDKWSKSKYAGISKKVYIPFGFECINEFAIKDDCRGNLVYVGNRYERDWCIDKYIPENIHGCMVYGNWKEGGRDSEDRWPNITFGKRLQTSEMYDVYSDYVATILLAKEEYCKHHFMTARLIEAVFYGTVPLFIEEYGEETIREYAGMYADFLTVRSKEEVINAIVNLSIDMKLRRKIIEYLRNRLVMMDSKAFVDDMLSLL